ncbi:MAG: trypsin-like peptidase domain-containing protein [Anaerolineae bacterium]|nr:trypsin-like peptidase domain-containing protein [Anaerolineae bacterium]
MTELQNLSEALVKSVETAGASTVRVEARRRLPATGVVWSAEGLVVTADHVVRRDEDIYVGLPGGAKVAAALVGRDPTTDLALLKAETQDLTPPAWAGDEALRVGSLVIAAGRPYHDMQATLGMIYTLGGSWRTPAGGRIDRYIQTDVTMYPGFSGGPLIDAAGQIIGLNTSGLLRDASLAIPVATLKRITAALLEHGHVKRGYLGVGMQPVRLPEALAKTLEQEAGLLLVSVEPGSPADTGGLLIGDIIVAFGGEPVEHMDDLLMLLGGDQAGHETAVRIVRGGELKEVMITVGAR